MEWTAARKNTSNVINVKNLLNTQSIQSQRQRARKTSSVSDRVIINVCGDRFITHQTTLELYPDTLLGNDKRRKYYYDPIHKEYFFDRHRACFEAILYYYQSHGRLRRPDYVPLDIFMEEVTFFQLGEEALKQIRKNENIKEVKKIHLPKNHIRRYLWATMEYPDYSLTAKIINIISLLLVIISTITLAVETLPQYTDLDDLDCIQRPTVRITTISYPNNTTDPSSTQPMYACQWYFATPFFIIQMICTGVFTIEFIVRLLTTPSLLDFIKNIMNWIDILAIVPFYVAFGIQLAGRQNEINTDTYIGLRLLRILRLARVLKFFRVFRSVKALRVLATTIRQSLLDFLIMIVILTLSGFLFGSAVYYAENDSNPDQFDSILKATYWGIITITSVGYGDIVVITPVGRIISCLCALSGAATTGMLVSVLVDRYQRVYVRKLYIQEDQIDFDDYSDDENNDTQLRERNSFTEHHRAPKIEDPDARAKEHTLEIPQTLDSTSGENDIGESSSGRVRFIIGYVDDDEHETSRNLVEKINSVVADEQVSRDNISLNIISEEDIQDSSPFDAPFQIESSSNDNVTEINRSCNGRGKVFKIHQHRTLKADKHLHNPENNV